MLSCERQVLDIMFCDMVSSKFTVSFLSVILSITKKVFKKNHLVST